MALRYNTELNWGVPRDTTDAATYSDTDATHCQNPRADATQCHFWSENQYKMRQIGAFAQTRHFDLFRPEAGNQNSG